MSARAWVAFAAVSGLWGIPYLFIKVAVDGGVSPAFVAWARVVLGAAVLLGLAARSGALSTLRGHWRALACYAVAEIAIPLPLIAAGEQHVSSSLAAILIASVPLIVALLAIRFDRAERATGLRLVGLLVGFAGVVVLMGVDVSGNGGALLGATLILIAAVGYSIGPLILKRHLTRLDPRAAMGGSMAVAAVVLTPFAAAAPPTAVPAANVVASLVVLGLLCTAAGFTIMAVLIKEIGPSRALVITYVTPVVAVFLGVVVLGEEPGAGATAGLLLILAGSWLSTDGRLPPGLLALARRLRPRTTAEGSRDPASRTTRAGGQPAASAPARRTVSSS